MEWIKENWFVISSIIAFLSACLGVVNQHLGDGKPKTVIQILIDLFALLPRPGTRGVLGPVNLPGVPSLEKKQ